MARNSETLGADSPADLALVRNFTADRGDAQFRALYDRHTPRLFGMALRLCGRSSDAEDLVQECWLRALRGHDRFEFRAKYGTWLTSILMNCFRERLRRTPAALEVQEDESSAQVETPIQAPAVDLERALAELASGYRAVLVLHDLYGYTHQEIGALLGIDAGTSKSQLHRARYTMRTRLSAAQPHPDDGKQ